MARRFLVPITIVALCVGSLLPLTTAGAVANSKADATFGRFAMVWASAYIAFGKQLTNLTPSTTSRQLEGYIHKANLATSKFVYELKRYKWAKGVSGDMRELEKVLLRTDFDLAKIHQSSDFTNASLVSQIRKDEASVSVSLNKVKTDLLK